MTKTKGSSPDRGSNPLRRIATVLDAVAFSSSGLTLQDIANAAQIPLSSAHRIANTLVDVGYLETATNQRVYQIGARMRRLLKLSFDDTSVEKLAAPLLSDLAQKVGEVAFICRLSGGRIKLEAFALPSEAPYSLIHPGYEYPFHATASGKAMLAYQSKEFIESVLAQDLPQFQSRTTIDRDALLAQLESVRANGFAINNMEFDPGIYALAAPVTFERGQVFLTIAIVGIGARIEERFSQEQLVSMVRNAAATLVHLLSSYR